MSKEYETSELIATAINNGDVKAEAALLTKYYSSVLFVLERKTGGDEIAKDLCQETFRIVLERLRSRPLDEPGKLAPFLHSVAGKLYIGEVRKLGRRKTFSDSEFVETVETAAKSQYDELLQEKSSEAIKSMIISMDNERDRKILYGFYIEEKDKEDICDELGLSNRHFDKVIFRAKQRFKIVLQKNGFFAD